MLSRHSPPITDRLLAVSRYLFAPRPRSKCPASLRPRSLQQEVLPCCPPTFKKYFLAANPHRPRLPLTEEHEEPLYRSALTRRVINLRDPSTSYRGTRLRPRSISLLQALTGPVYLLPRNTKNRHIGLLLHVELLISVTPTKSYSWTPISNYVYYTAVL